MENVTEKFGQDQTQDISHSKSHLGSLEEVWMCVDINFQIKPQETQLGSINSPVSGMHCHSYTKVLIFPWLQMTITFIID